MFVVPERITKDLVSIEEAIAAIEAALISLEKGTGQLFPVATGRAIGTENVFSAKSGQVEVNGSAILGVKVGSYWPGNGTIGLPSHGSTVIILDERTGEPHAVLGAGYLTALRTAAIDAVAVKYLARADASVVGIVGAGAQALTDLRAVSSVRQISRAYVWSRSTERVASFLRAAESLAFEVHQDTIEHVVAQADILITATDSRAPLVKREWVRLGTHISAMGADGSGKQELDVETVSEAVLFADVVAQSISIGEFQHAVRAGLVATDSIGTIGAVAAGRTPGRASPRDITIFDSSGTAIQDLAIAQLALSKALALNRAISMNW
jgi:ornithine cyclodeaminase